MYTLTDDEGCNLYWVFRVKCGNETCYGNARLPYEFKLIAMVPNMVLEAPMYALLTQLLDTSNYRVVSAVITTDIVISTKNYAYRIYTVRFVVAIKGANSDCDRNPFIARLL